MSSFDSFLKKMMGEDASQEKIHEGRERTGGSKKQSNTPRPSAKPKPQKQVVNESQEDDGEIVERALEYAATFTKIVRKNFPDKSNRQIVLEFVRNAINMMLGESTGSVSQASNARPSQSIESKPSQEEDPYEILRQAQTSRLPENFNPNAKVEGDLNIKGKMNEKGETEIDLSSMTSEDMQALKVLSGIVPVPGQERTSISKEAEEEVRAVMNG